MPMQARLYVIAIAITSAVSFTVASVCAQISPGGPIMLVVPTVPGGGIDVYARILANQFTEIGQPMIVENRPGGGTNIGTNYVAKSAPNGRTLLITVNTYTINAALSKSLPFEPLKDLLPVTFLGFQPFIIGVNADLPVQSLEELIT